MVENKIKAQIALIDNASKLFINGVVADDDDKFRLLSDLTDFNATVAGMIFVKGNTLLVYTI